MELDPQVLQRHFPVMDEKILDQLKAFGELIFFWNDKINVISRKDIENLFSHHILHSLFLLKLIEFKEGAEILDLGTGGGFPGIPLAICYPEVNFHLVDARAKKIKVVQEVIEVLGLENVTAEHIRVEDMSQQFDFVVSRAVAKLDQLLAWSRPRIKDQHQHALPNGLITLKGGDIDLIKSELPKFEYIEDYPISEWTDIDYYKEKYILYVQA